MAKSNLKALFSKAHQQTKAFKKLFPSVDYGVQFGIFLKQAFKNAAKKVQENKKNILEFSNLFFSCGLSVSTIYLLISFLFIGLASFGDNFVLETLIPSIPYALSGCFLSFCGLVATDSKRYKLGASNER